MDQQHAYSAVVYYYLFEYCSKYTDWDWENKIYLIYNCESESRVATIIRTNKNKLYTLHWTRSSHGSVSKEKFKQVTQHRRHWFNYVNILIWMFIILLPVHAQKTNNNLNKHTVTNTARNWNPSLKLHFADHKPLLAWNIPWQVYVKSVVFKSRQYLYSI